jgi:hypothetical protein
LVDDETPEEPCDPLTPDDPEVTTLLFEVVMIELFELTMTVLLLELLVVTPLQKPAVCAAVICVLQAVPTLSFTTVLHEATLDAGSSAQQVASVVHAAAGVPVVVPLSPVSEVLLELHAMAASVAVTTTGMAKAMRRRFMAGHLTRQLDRVKMLLGYRMTKTYALCPTGGAPSSVGGNVPSAWRVSRVSQPGERSARRARGRRCRDGAR